jgi:hypothetical protein
MSIQDDIEALEKVLEAFKPTPYGIGSNADGWDAFEEACDPDRIRRLLDALYQDRSDAIRWRFFIESQKQPGQQK